MLSSGGPSHGRLHNRKKLTCNSFEGIARILAGPDAEEFFFHKSLLCDLAPFFKAALEGSFKEASEAKINMPEEISEVLRRFSLWAYTGSILQDGGDVKGAPWETLVRLYLFAERYDIPDLQNVVIDNVVAKYKAENTIPTPWCHLIYSDTMPTSPLRRFMVDVLAQKANLNDWFKPEAHLLSLFPPVFMFDLARAQYNLRKGKAKDHDWYSLGCTFHVHPATTTESKQESNIETSETT